MSRSRKKPYYTDQQSGCTKHVKRRAARAVRAANKKACAESDKEEVGSGKNYRKVFNPWNIRDYSFFGKDPKAKRK